MNNEPIYLINSAHGVYIPQIFARSYRDNEFNFKFEDHDRAEKLMDELLNDPYEYEFYHEAYDELLSMDIIFNGETFYLYHDEDLWLCHEECNFFEQQG